MDPLSDVLSLVKPRAYASGALTAGGDWSVQFDAHEGIKCYVVTKGECWIVVDGVDQPVRLGKGDFLMLPRARPFRLCSDPERRPVDARTMFAGVGHRYNGVLTITPGDEVTIIGGHFALAGNVDLLLSVLPPVIHLPNESNRSVLVAAVERIMSELREPQLGGSLLAQQSATTLLVLALRRYLAIDGIAGVGWLFALADERIACAMGAIHAQPAAAWTVQSLAERAGMSRTAFAERFRRLVGSSPLDYVTRWRMLLAAERLRNTSDSIAVIAEAVGYESESAFGAAFKRTMGASPREFVRAKRPIPQA